MCVKDCEPDCPWYNEERGWCDRFHREEATCEINYYSDGLEKDEWGFMHLYEIPYYELSCGHYAEGSAKPRFCPDCGASVVK